MSDIQHIGGRTPDLTEENVDKLVALFPDVLTEVTDQQTGKAESGDYDDDGGQLVVNPESNGRFHSDWCSMIYPRLLLARDLLASDEPLEYARLYLDGNLLDVSVSQSVYIRTFYRSLI